MRLFYDKILEAFKIPPSIEITSIPFSHSSPRLSKASFINFLFMKAAWLVLAVFSKRT